MWIAADTMLVAAGASVPVDLTGVPLDSYLAVQPGAWVRVTGTWTEGGRLFASSLEVAPGVPGPAQRSR